MNDVLLGELAECEHLASRALLGNRIATLRDVQLRFARQLACISQRHGWVAPAGSGAAVIEGVVNTMDVQTRRPKECG